MPNELAKKFPGGNKSTRALMAHLADHGDACWIFEVIDAAVKAGAPGATELAAAIEQAAQKAGLR